MAISSASAIAPGMLWGKIQQQTDHALACGALQPIETHYEFVEQEGMRFLVRLLANLARKQQATQAQTKQRQAGQDVNPFLPYDEDLFVTHLSETHLCLLNKYNVVDHHILLVTRAFEDQDTWLTLADFEALAICMAEIDGLAFYNGGRLAGASQRHKHLQLVPLPLCPDGSPLPLAPSLESLGLGAIATHPNVNAELQIKPFQSPNFPFHHAIVPLAGPSPTAPGLWAAYHSLLTHLGMDGATSPLSCPYNLLITRQWMMVVARRQEHYQSIPVNSLGFAGSLLVKNQAQLALLKSLGPMTILQNVACAAQP
jgi:sulfate adenylyltransferase (ADP) / ATP adenylyltransferase